MGFLEGHVWQGIQWLLVFIACQVVLQIGINTLSPPHGEWELTYVLRESNCAEFIRHIETKLDPTVALKVAPLGPAEISQICVVFLGNEVSSELWNLGPPNRAIVQAARSFGNHQNHELTAGAFLLRSEHTLTRAFGDWYQAVVNVTALVFSLAWLWWWHLRPILNAQPPRLTQIREVLARSRSPNG